MHTPRQKKQWFLANAYTPAAAADDNPGLPRLVFPVRFRFFGPFRPNNLKMEWDDKTGLPKLVIPVRFEVFWPKRAQKIPKRTGMTILESPCLSSQSISGFSGRKGAWASQACHQPLVPIPEKRLPKGPWSPEAKKLPVLTATHILGSRLFAGAPNPDKRLPKGPWWLWPVLSATHIRVGKPLFEGPNSLKKRLSKGHWSLPPAKRITGLVNSSLSGQTPGNDF